MKHQLTKFFRQNLNKITGSIAFFPAVIAIVFLVLSYLMISFDFSETGKHFKASYSWIRLRDASTARSIASVVVGGIISLAVFSFSMVMILLNQAASQLSNRMLESMISKRFQQIVLGFYIGTIVYALFLLSTIRDVNTGIYVPALSIYLLVIFTVGDIFLFIYFLHYVTQSVKYETIIKRVHYQTKDALDKVCTSQIAGNSFCRPNQNPQVVTMTRSHYYQDYDEHEVINFAKMHSGVVEMLHPRGTYLLTGTPLLNFYGNTISASEMKELLSSFDFYVGQPVDKNPYFGYHQLAEVALKALSPGINDPQTAVMAIHAISDLLYFRLDNFIKENYCDEVNQIRFYTPERTFETLFTACCYPIWDYGKNDQYIQDALLIMCDQLLFADVKKSEHPFLLNFKSAVTKKISERKL